MSIIEALHTFVNGYEPLQNNRINVDFLPEKAKEYSLEAVPCTEWVRAYVDGSGIKQFLFNLCSRELLDETLRTQMDNLGFYEAFSEWLRRQTLAGRLPDLGSGRRAARLEATSSGYVFDQGANTARYQIQCKLTYYQEKE